MKEESLVADRSGRLDQFLAGKFSGYSRSHFKDLILSKRVLVNGSARPPDFRLSGGEVIRIHWAPRAWPEFPFEKWVLREDSEFLALNKPAGLLVHPLGPSWINQPSAAQADAQPNLAGLLLRHRPQAASSGVSRCGIVHRLDRQTSGVLLIAKTPQAQESLLTAFRERKVHKIYRAIVFGDLRKTTVEAPIGRLSGRRSVAVTPWGKEASTEFKPLAWARDVSLIEAQPRTGRTHQIRAHLALLKSPVLGDNEWFKAPQAAHIKALGYPEPPRMMLHAYRIHFSHPKQGTEIAVTAPLPKDFKDYWARCQGGAR